MLYTKERSYKEVFMKHEINWEEYEKVLLKRPGFKKVLKETQLEYEIARELIKARIDKGLTQAEVARRMKTKQSVISRVENARSVPSLSFLKRLAAALNMQLHIRFT